MPRSVRIHTDGASRGNPGPASAAFVLVGSDGSELCARARFLGTVTNNVAEYTALRDGLAEASRRGVEAVEIFTDSELMARQLLGEYRVKSAALAELYSECMALLGRFRGWRVEHVRRERNRRADVLANKSLDRQSDVDESGIDAGKRVRLGVLISGGGRTLLNINDEIERGNLNATIGVVISSRSVVAGVERARKAGLEVRVVRRKDHADIDSFSRRIAEELDAAGVDLVVQAGWLCLWRIPSQYGHRVMNIHPALLPSFGGQGMWGHHVHEAVLSAGCKVSGCTVHFCTNEYDKGPIIVQRCCEVRGDDNADSLAARVFEQECIAYPEAIRMFARGAIRVEGNVARVVEG